MIDYTVHQTVVSDALRDLLINEFNCEIILDKEFSPARLTKGQYIRYWFVPSELSSLTYAGEYRTYNIEIVYYFDIHRKRYESSLSEIYEKVEKLKQLMIDNVSYAPSGNYKWHYLSVGNIEVEKLSVLEDIENAEDVIGARINISITRGNF